MAADPTTPDARSTTAAGVSRRARSEAAGWVFCGAVAALAWLLSRELAGLSVAAASILLGLVAGNLPPLRARVRAGARRWAGTGLEVTIVVLGLTISLADLPGRPQLAGLLAVMVTTLLIATLAGRGLGLGGRAGLLGGVGTAVCGSAAIAAASPVLRAGGATVAAALASINLLSAAGMFVLPAAATLLGIDDAAAGWWTGGSLQAMGQAIGAGFAFSPEAGEAATAIKLFRVATLVVLLPAIGLATGRRSGARPPWFVPAFVAAVAIAWRIGTPAWVAPSSGILLAASLAGIGAGIHPPSLLRQGPRMFALCALAFAVQFAGVVVLVALQSG